MSKNETRSVKLSTKVADRLRREAFRRRERGEDLASQTAIADVAITEWLDRNRRR